MQNKQIVFTQPGKAELLNIPVDNFGDNDVVVETAVSMISCGTERALIRGNQNVSAAGNKVEFPRMSGYSGAGTVVKIGNAVKTVKPGDRVAVYWGFHKKYNIVNENQVVKLENDNITFETAALAFISTFSMAAIRKTRLEMGESAIVMGLGILGTLAVKLLHAGGAVPIIAADPNEKRRKIALQNGADYAFDPTEEDFAQKVKNITGGGVNVAIEVTGNGAGFNQALDCMAKFGRVALLGCTRDSDFTVDYYKKIHAPGITVVGAHTGARPETESHPGWFTHRDDIKAVLKMCAGGRLCLENIVTETHSPEECGKVYNRLLFDKDFPIAVRFDWRGVK